MNRPLKIIIAVVAVIAVAIVGLYIAGIRPYVVSSDSMSPKYPKNSLAFLNSRVKAEDIKVDDVIGIRVGDTMVFHRVGEIDRETGTAVLFGDLLGKDAGREVELNNSVLLGKEVLTIPGIGSVVSGLIGHGGLVVAIGAALIVLCLVPWERIVGNRRKKPIQVER